MEGKVAALALDEAIDACPVVVLATPFLAARDIVTRHDQWSGKTLVDCTNPIGPGFQLLYGYSSSGAEEIASWTEGAHVVKCFNTTGFENMMDPDYGGHRATMFLCGDDDSAKQLATELCEALGFEACDAGPLTHARYLEPLAMLWIHLARVQGHGAGIAFKLLRR
jgi:predicted dinucleotide-binding enzyme